MALANGKRKYLYGKNRQDVSRKLTAALADRLHGIPAPDDRMTTGRFLERWLHEVAKPTVRPSTFERYEGVVRLHLLPSLGRIPIAKLTPAHVQTLLNAKSTEGLSPASVQYIRGTLRTALQRALKWSVVQRNVASLADPPRQIRTEIRPLSPDEIDRFFAAIEGDPYEPLYRVALTTGLRKGELLGLRWKDVDLEQRELRVRNSIQRVGGRLISVEPKTNRSRRTIRLTEMAVTALRKQQSWQSELRRAAGTEWKELDLVFASVYGTPHDPRNILRRFQASVTKANLTHRRFHDLRHSTASLLLLQGVPARVVMEILGHSQIAVTMNTYSHVMPTLQEEAADRMDSFFRDRLTASPTASPADDNSP